MAATNHTPNYNLPVFVNDDIPTWLGDWNTAMGDIDTALKNISDSSGSDVDKAYVDSKIQTVTDKVSQLEASVSRVTDKVAELENDYNVLQGQVELLKSGMSGVVYVGSAEAGITAGEYEKLAKKA